IASLRSQISAGADAVQVFDTWSGSLSPGDYERYVFPATKRVFDGVADLGVPRIHFSLGSSELLELIARLSPDVVGLDWRTPLDRAASRIGAATALQGNLDAGVCLAPWGAVEAAARAVL